FNYKLEKMVAERTHELKMVNKELESFSYSVSHDLRAPLRAINGYAQMLLEDFEKILPEDGMRQLRVIMDNGKRMGQLIDDLLHYSRLGKVEIQDAPFSLNTLVEEVIQELRQAHPTETNFIVHDLGTIHADRRLFKQVLINL